MKCATIQKCLIIAFAISAVLVSSVAAQDGTPLGFVSKLGQEVDIRSGARILADDFAAGKVILPDLATPVAAIPAVPQIQFRGGNTQANNPPADYVQIFSGFRPFVHAVQSEVSMAASGRNIVVTYNDSAGLHVSLFNGGPSLVVDRVLLSGFATSNDGGATWTPGFIPPSPGGDTFGDPSVGVDRHGNFYFANLAADSTSGTVNVNRSTDGGRLGATASSCSATMPATRNGWRLVRTRRSRAATMCT